MVRWQLKELALERGYNPHSLAMEAKLSYNTVRPIWLNQSRRADLDTIGKLARALKIKPGELLVEAGDA